MAIGGVARSSGTAGSAGPFFRGGKLKFLVIAAPKRIAGCLGVPTVAEAGGPTSFEVEAWVALQVPKSAPAATSAKVVDALTNALAEPDVKEKFATLGFEPFVCKPAQMSNSISTSIDQ